MADGTDLTPTPLEQAAVRMHETYLALHGAGFTEDQALRIVALIVKEPAPRDDPEAPG